MFKKIISIITLVILITQSISVYAHESMLNIDYDDCIVPMEGGVITPTDGEDETWYWLINNLKEYHISHETETIRYYFSDSAKDNSSYTWTTELSESEAAEIKQAYADSVKKWNDIYYFSYDENGNRSAHKIINVIEAENEESSNLIIYPINTAQTTSAYYAATGYFYNGENAIETVSGIKHYHYQKWYMKVNIDYFKSSYSLSSMVRERTGQHELGHVLGLFDVDLCCSSSVLQDHHEEILMGYGNGARSTYAKYKDIAGVAITRGFHTDDDHMWMLRTNADNTQDVICALCNGVRYGITLTNGKYEDQTPKAYQSCIHHGGVNEQMLLVASDGNRYFYKCLYCRHIEETYHEHTYSDWVSISDTRHIECCECGVRGTTTGVHVTKASNIVNGKSYCIHCGYMVTLTEGFIPIIHNVQKVSVNGSYILSNGIIVLVDEDVEAYMNGTLVFYDKDKLPELE